VWQLTGTHFGAAAEAGCGPANASIIAKPNAMTKTPRIFNLPVLVGLTALKMAHLSGALLPVDSQKLDAIWLRRVIRSDEDALALRRWADFS
jgi:hypothetical protein